MYRFVSIVCVVVSSIFMHGTSAAAAEVSFSLTRRMISETSGFYKLNVRVSNDDNAGLAGYDIELLNIDSLVHAPPAVSFGSFVVGGFNGPNGFNPVNGKLFASQTFSGISVFGLAQPFVEPTWPTPVPGMEFPLHWTGTLASGSYSGPDLPTFGSEANATVYVTEDSIETIGSLSVSPLVHGAVAPADFNQDGNVDGVDFGSWLNGQGLTGTATHSDGDADGDGDVDGADNLIWQAMRTEEFVEYDGNGVDGPVTITLFESTSIAADANGDGVVDGVDFGVWQNNFFGAYDFRVGYNSADFNLDGSVDGGDFLIWQNQFGLGFGGSGSDAVPEPNALVLSLLVLMSFALGRSGKR